MPGNNLIAVSGKTPGYSAGKFGQCMSAGMASAELPARTTGAPITVDCWVKSPTTAAAVNIALGQGGSLYIKQDATTGAWGAAANGSNTLNPAGTTPCFDTNWHHIRFCNNGTTSYLFVDGVLQSTRASHSINSSTNPFAVRGLNTGFDTDASVDEVAVFDYCMSTASFTPPTAPWANDTPGLVALWHLDGSGMDSAGLVADTTPPAMIGAISVSNVTSSGFTLSWPAASDAVGVTGYEVSTNGGTSWLDVGNVLYRSFTGLTGNTSYETRVRAYDASGNRPAPLALAVLTEPASDTVPPMLTGSIAVSAVTSSGYTFSWPSASDNVGVTGYEFSTNGGGAWSDAGIATSWTISAATPNTTYQLRVRAYDAANLRSAELAESVTTLEGSVTPPTPIPGFTDNILFSPWNWDVTGSSAFSNHNGAYFRFIFGGASCTLNFDVTGIQYTIDALEYRVDGKDWVYATLAASVPITIPAELATPSTGKHLLEVRINFFSFNNTRWTDPIEGVKLTGVILESGKALEKPQARHYKIMAYGDSITEGWKSLPDKQMINSRHSYAVVMAEFLGAELGVAAFAGQGFLNGGNGYIPAFTETYNKLYPGKDRVFTEAPDIIMINMGTNGANGQATIDAAVTVINSLLSMTPSTTKIAVLRPFNGARATELQNAVATVNSSRVSYIDTTGFFTPTATGDKVHPLVFDNLIIGPKVADRLRPLLPSLGNSTPPTLTARTVTLTLGNESGPLANLTGLKVSFYDEPTPDLHTVPRFKAANVTTDASGVMTITVQSTLAAGGSGSVVVQMADGRNLVRTVVVA